jgi:hypothetical protein
MLVLQMLDRDIKKATHIKQTSLSNFRFMDESVSSCQNLTYFLMVGIVLQNILVIWVHLNYVLCG